MLVVEGFASVPGTDHARSGILVRIAALVALFACAGPAAGRDGSCMVFEETFDSFVGPHDFNDEQVDVRWCLNGASVASGGFCGGGTALKLISTSDEATIRVQLMDDACATVTLRFVYSQFAETGTVLRQTLASAARSLCNNAVPTIVGELDVIGGACIEVTHTIDIEPGQAVLWRFDHGQPANTAIFIDDVTVEVTGCCGMPGDHGCCEAGAAGCADAEVMQCVCEIDPYCCETAWDEQCVALVEELSCGNCDQTGSEECLTSFTIDFGEMFTAESPCAVLPDLFEQCGGSGVPFLTNSGDCAGSGDASLAFASGFPHSYAETSCLDLTGMAEAVLSFSYTKNTGTLGPSIQVVADDESIETIWSAPIIFDGGCANEVIDLSELIAAGPFRLRFASGSSIANGARIDDVTLVSSHTALHGCCEPGEPGCADAAVQACVCDIDPFCCEQAWDELCVISAEFYACDDCDLCAEMFTADFDVPDPGGSPCDRFPELFAGCFGTGPLLSNATPCSDDPTDYAAVFISGDEISSVVTRCISLADVTAASLTLEYSKIDGTIGPVFEASADVGGTWVPLWVAPESPGPGSHRACINLDAAVGLNFLLFRLRAGDVGVAGQVVDDLELVVSESCPSQPGDVTGDGLVGLDDLLLVIGQWGLACPPGAPCEGDANGDGLVGLSDLLMVIGHWSAGG